MAQEQAAPQASRPANHYVMAAGIPVAAAVSARVWLMRRGGASHQLGERG